MKITISYIILDRLNSQACSTHWVGRFTLAGMSEACYNQMIRDYDVMAFLMNFIHELTALIKHWFQRNLAKRHV